MSRGSAPILLVAPMVSVVALAAVLMLAVALTLGVAGGVAAHSLTDVERELRERETYTEIVERPAPGFTLQDPEGREISLADYHGKVVVLWFLYALCPDVCPLQSQVLAGVQEQVNRTPMRELVQFVTITTDPERDTPDILSAYGPDQGLDRVNWIFLTSGPDRPEDATRRIAGEYGLDFSLTEDGTYQMHGVVTHLIDREGVLRARYHGLRFDPTNMILHINALTHDDHEPTQIVERSFWHRIKALLPW